LLSFALLLSACSGDGEGGGASGGASAGSNGVAGSPSAGGGSGGSSGTTSGAGAAGSSGGSSTGGMTSSAGGSSGTPTGGVSGTPMAGASGSGGAPANGGTSPGGAAGSAGSNGNPGSGVVGAPIGFATLNGGTSGGKGGQVVMVSTYADFKSYAESATPHVILVSGTISNGANGGVVRVGSNKSLVGVGSSAFLDGIGLLINNASNIIVQNLRISLAGVTTRTDTGGVYTSSGDGGLPRILVNDGDAISIAGTSKNIWIDHCELFSESPSVQTNGDLYDGLIDIKGQTGFITISWNFLHDHHKGGLVGASDTDLFADRKITLHHNHYSNVRLRAPMYRGAVGHFFNNYVAGATDATEIRAGTCVRVEKNYYEALHFSIYTTSDSPGSTERIDNVEVSRTARDYPANCTAAIPYDYSSALTGTTSDVKTLVPAGAGVGKL